MAGFHRETLGSLTPEMKLRLVRAMLASVATGGIIYLLVMHVALPALGARQAPAQIEWLRQAFAEHPMMILGTIVALAALLAVPVLGVFRWVDGPLTTLTARRHNIDSVPRAKPPGEQG
jgi:hypothetical protein